MKKAKISGFTLIEILLAVAALVILAGIVILAINPTKQLADTRNAKRQMDVNTILNGVYQWSIDNNGAIPNSIHYAVGYTSTTEICRTTGVNCSNNNLVDLGVLFADELYLVAIPTDPNAQLVYGSGYHIYRSLNGRITVVAPSTENGKAIISVTR
jgi:prepilin-type N-terminal cleavage/methylation domain-containing protein